MHNAAAAQQQMPRGDVQRRCSICLGCLAPRCTCTAPHHHPGHTPPPSTNPPPPVPRSYGAEQGQGALREALASAFYPGMRSADEVFVSDGSKCDISRIQLMFGANVSIAVQDPSYPAYVDTGVIMGMTGEHNGTGFDNIQYMACRWDEGGLLPAGC